ncbi:hypothetical protein Q1695_000761 [Nippostrongylus brasiliensis]|nr:hypothetical protein Q1695_000761 [Nippostrongylus brasiliensis]
MSVTPPLADQLPRINKFVGESFEEPTITRTIFVSSEEDTKKRENRVILLIGPQSAGKSSLIDFLCNYFYGAELEDTKRYHIANEKFDSTTPEKQIITYVFNDSVVDFRPVVIDTPSTSGLHGEENRRILEQWLKDNDKLKIDAIGVVFSAYQRMTTAEEEGLQMALELFSSHMQPKQVVFLTGSDGSSPPVGMLRRFNLDRASVYKINTSCIFQRPEDDPLQEHLRGNYWRMSVANFGALFSRLKYERPTSNSAFDNDSSSSHSYNSPLSSGSSKFSVDTVVRRVGDSVVDTITDRRTPTTGSRSGTFSSTSSHTTKTSDGGRDPQMNGCTVTKRNANGDIVTIVEYETASPEVVVLHERPQPDSSVYTVTTTTTKVHGEPADGTTVTRITKSGGIDSDIGSTTGSASDAWRSGSHGRSGDVSQTSSYEYPSKGNIREGLTESTITRTTTSTQQQSGGIPLWKDSPQGATSIQSGGEGGTRVVAYETKTTGSGSSQSGERRTYSPGGTRVVTHETRTIGSTSGQPGVSLSSIPADTRVDAYETTGSGQSGISRSYSPEGTRVVTYETRTTKSSGGQFGDPQSYGPGDTRVVTYETRTAGGVDGRPKEPQSYAHETTTIGNAGGPPGEPQPHSTGNTRVVTYETRTTGGVTDGSLQRRPHSDGGTSTVVTRETTTTVESSRKPKSGISSQDHSYPHAGRTTDGTPRIPHYDHVPNEPIHGTTSAFETVTKDSTLNQPQSGTLPLERDSTERDTRPLSYTHETIEYVSSETKTSKGTTSRAPHYDVPPYTPSIGSDASHEKKDSYSRSAHYDDGLKHSHTGTGSSTDARARELARLQFYKEMLDGSEKETDPSRAHHGKTTDGSSRIPHYDVVPHESSERLYGTSRSAPYDVVTQRTTVRDDSTRFTGAVGDPYADSNRKDRSSQSPHSAAIDSRQPSAQRGNNLDLGTASTRPEVISPDRGSLTNAGGVTRYVYDVSTHTHKRYNVGGQVGADGADRTSDSTPPRLSPRETLIDDPYYPTTNVERSGKGSRSLTPSRHSWHEIRPDTLNMSSPAGADRQKQHGPHETVIDYRSPNDASAVFQRYDPSRRSRHSSGHRSRSMDRLENTISPVGAGGILVDMRENPEYSLKLQSGSAQSPGGKAEMTTTTGQWSGIVPGRQNGGAKISGTEMIMRTMPGRAGEHGSAMEDVTMRNREEMLRKTRKDVERDSYPANSRQQHAIGSGAVPYYDQPPGDGQMRADGSSIPVHIKMATKPGAKDSNMSGQFSNSEYGDDWGEETTIVHKIDKNQPLPQLVEEKYRSRHYPGATVEERTSTHPGGVDVQQRRPDQDGQIHQYVNGGGIHVDGSGREITHVNGAGVDRRYPNGVGRDLQYTDGYGREVQYTNGVEGRIRQPVVVTERQQGTGAGVQNGQNGPPPYGQRSAPPRPTQGYDAYGVESDMEYGGAERRPLNVERDQGHPLKKVTTTTTRPTGKDDGSRPNGGRNRDNWKRKFFLCTCIPLTIAVILLLICLYILSQII